MAIINVARDQAKGEEQVRRLRDALAKQPELAALPLGELSRALEQPIEPQISTQVKLDEVKRGLERADRALSDLDYDRVLVELSDAEAILLTVTPSAETSALLARLAFTRGDIHLRRGQKDQGVREFRVVRRLDPSRPSPDPTRHHPRVVRAFERAGQPSGARATLRVVSPFDGAAVYINGRLSRATPGVNSVEPGIHYVAGKHWGQSVIGRRVVVPAGGERTVKLVFDRVTVDERARYVRRGLLAQARAAQARLAKPAVKAVARRVGELTSADVVVIIGDDRVGQSLALAFYMVSGRRLTRWRQIAENSATRLLTPLGVRSPDLVPRHVPDRQRAREHAPASPSEPWWHKSRVRAGIAIGVIVSVVGMSLYQLGSESGPSTVSGSTCCGVSDGSRPPDGSDGSK